MRRRIEIVRLEGEQVSLLNEPNWWIDVDVNGSWYTIAEHWEDGVVDVWPTTSRKMGRNKTSARFRRNQIQKDQ